MAKPEIRSKVLGVGYYVPRRVVLNKDLATVYKIDTSDEWIRQRTGIEERHFVDAGVTNADWVLRLRSERSTTAV